MAEKGKKPNKDLPASFTLKDLSSLVRGTVVGDGEMIITGAAGIEEAKVGEVTFLSNRRYFKFLKETKASAVIISKGLETKPEVEGLNLCVTKDPYLAYALILDKLYPAKHPAPGIASNASVDKDSSIGSGVHIGAFVVIEAGVKIGDNTVIYPNTYIGKDSVIGSNSLIYPNVTIRERITIGSGVTIHPGTTIGGDGFGYANDGNTKIKVPQIGTVTIGDDVELGSNVTIDRGTTGATFIGRGTKIDNLVQIGHNARIGEDCVIVAQTGIAGSATIGDRVTIAGQSAVVGHIAIADDSVIGGKSAVTNDIKDRGVYTGYPAVPHRQWLKTMGVFATLPELKKKVKELEEKLNELTIKKEDEIS
ncbi:MAG: UDP-3-O-(3-hydroxymyristoyl)glucosamine N-acyltransferase [Deltaproteobacteria bacterium]|nr:UDP-3-O-(3-hydroxymyristoyl)glucosamine N-acyltransferase [Deltaproteobacteria bacterium]